MPVNMRFANKNEHADRGEHRDPLTGTRGARPVGTGMGAMAGGAAGAAFGSVLPGVGNVFGAAIGAIVGALAGGLVGKEIAEMIDPTAEEIYWQHELTARPYYDQRFTFRDDYSFAYAFGYVMRIEYTGREFNDVEHELEKHWEKARGDSRLTWNLARPVIADAWNRCDYLADQVLIVGNDLPA